MGNCRVTPHDASNVGDYKWKKRAKQNPFVVDYGVSYNVNDGGHKLYVLKNPTATEIGFKYELGRELWQGEFGITYLCTDRESMEELAYKSILKKKLRTAIDIVDVRREVKIMKHPNIHSLKDTYEDDDVVHLVMELCEGGELFDRIVARGHYTERADAAVIKAIVEVVQVFDWFSLFYVDSRALGICF